VKKRIVLLGPPASGKGTQAEMIKDRFQIEPTSPGAMLRDEMRRGTPLGIEADSYTSHGQLVPDSLVIELVKSWLETHDGSFVFDGFPRTIAQAEALESILAARNTPLEVAFFFEIRVERIRERVLNRVSCEECGRIFGAGFHFDSARQACPVCSGKLIRRKDDTLEALEQRMEEYRQKTEPLVKFYRQRGILHELCADARPETVFSEISTVLEAA